MFLAKINHFVLDMYNLF